ncbi:hypothetical protein [Acidithiobacillus sp.]|uniref:hypothetical protein n=1 Tax=Acidithiobacillus sp. TaxID=1872118 RepID=UPI002586FCAC|nr:hypothetical protein [Acidithiobacillus sp.]MDD5375756.1 hypothetical protein [Acidithiobacillus sp.]
MGEFFVGIWRALTAAGRSFSLGAVESWGFWSTTLLLLGTFILGMEMVGGVIWRMVESRMKPKMRDKEAEARLREEIRELKAKLYDNELERVRLAEKSNEQERVIEANRSWHRNWNADAGKVAK